MNEKQKTIQKLKEKVRKAIAFPKVIWDNYCCVFGARIDKCPSWSYDCEKCMGTAMYWRGDKIIVLNPRRINNAFFLGLVLLHELTHHLIHVFRFPKTLHKIIDFLP